VEGFGFGRREIEVRNSEGVAVNSLFLVMKNISDDDLPKMFT